MTSIEGWRAACAGGAGSAPENALSGVRGSRMGRDRPGTRQNAEQDLGVAEAGDTATTERGWGGGCWMCTHLRAGK